MSYEVELTPIHPSVLGIIRRLREWCDECEHRTRFCAKRADKMRGWWV